MSDKNEQYLGFLEGASAVSMLIAPIIGSVMYTYFGFEVTFWILGGIDYIIAACIVFIIPNDVDVKDSFMRTSSFVKNDPAQIHLR